MTAGPMARAFRFLKSTSVSCGAVDETVAAGVTEEESAGEAPAGGTLGDSAAGDLAGGVSSCASAIEETNHATMKASRVLISMEDKSWPFTLAGQAHRWQKKFCSGAL